MYVFSVVASFCLLFLDIESRELILVISVMVVKGGVSCCFILTYQLLPHYFLPVQRTTAFGLTNIVSRVISLTPSLVAEMQDPIPMMSCFGFSLLGMCGGLYLTYKNPKTCQELQEEGNKGE